jgi:hypothetical protein
LNTEIVLNEDADFIIINEEISHEWFVDIEEVNLDATFSTKIDIEKPASISVPHSFQLKIPVNNKIARFSFPIHMRYNDCSYKDFAEIEL